MVEVKYRNEVKDFKDLENQLLWQYRDVIWDKEILYSLNLDENEKVIHLFGKPESSRNFILSNREAVISPAWSIHTGAGTTNYKFVWSTAGENITYSDFNPVATKSLN